MNDDKRTTAAVEGEAWVGRVRSALDQPNRELDASTLSRLNRARQAALAVVQDRRRTLPWWPAAVATAAVLALAVVLVRMPEPVVPAAPVVAEDFDVIAAQDSLELYENLEFYAWLDAQPADG